MTRPHQDVDDRLIDVAASVVARLAHRHGIGKYDLLTHLLVGSLVLVGVFTVVLLIPADRREEAVTVAFFAGLTGLRTVTLLVACIRSARRIDGPGAAKDDAVSSARLRLEERGTRAIEAGTCGFLLFLSVLALVRGYPVFMLVFASNLAVLVAEYVRCVPMVPPRRRHAPAPSRPVARVQA